MRRTLSALALVLLAAFVAGCGVAKSVKNTIDPVAQAADVTANVPGYRVAATMTMSIGSNPVTATLSGVFDRRDHTGTMQTKESVLGHHVSVVEKFSGLTFYMQASGLPGANKLTGGKPWIKYDMSKIIGSLGMSGLPTSGTDPSQFVDYLRAVSASTKKVGTQTIRGVFTTHYHAVVDLNKYSKIIKPTPGSSSGQAVKTLEQVLGTHTLPMDAWIDSHRLVRRISFAFPECVANQHVHLAMTMDLYDYGQQPATSLPGASQTFDLTPMMSSAMSNVKLGCSAS